MVGYFTVLWVELTLIHVSNVTDVESWRLLLLKSSPADVNTKYAICPAWTVNDDVQTFQSTELFIVTIDDK